MRKSQAPSARDTVKRPKLESVTFPGSSNDPNTVFRKGNTTGKLLFKAVWREISNKKHKTWKDDGTVTVVLAERKAVLKDRTGKYMGRCVVHQRSGVIEEGLELIIGDKEVELLEQVTDMKEFCAIVNEHDRARDAKQSIEEAKANAAEEKKPKGSFVFRPSFPTSLMQKPQFLTNQGRDTFVVPKKEPLPQTEETLVLPTPDGIGANEEFNPHGHPVVEVRVSAHLAQVLRPHQREGVAFLYACLMGFRQRDHYGCILADDMGLGKTLQCLVVAQTLLRTGPFGGERVVQRVLIVTPSSLTRNWNGEVNRWLQSDRLYAYVVSAKRKLGSYLQQQHIPFVIVSYESLHQHVAEFQQLKFDLLICDEGHRLKNQATKIFAALCDLNIRRRVILTGTPVQNDLGELFALANFVNPGVFGSPQQFRVYYAAPIEQSQCPSAGAEVLELARTRAAELHELSGKFLLRRSQDINRRYLRKKQEYVCFVRPTKLQALLLQKALELYAESKESILEELSPLQIIAALKKICNHPSLVARTKSINIFTRKLQQFLPDFMEMGAQESAKLQLVQDFLNTTAVERREKCVLVSNYTNTLNMLQSLCSCMDIKCLRLDGSTPAAERQMNVDNFNAEWTVCNSDEPLVFLLSAKAGGLGLNLIGASRLILYDSDWNPATDAQAAARIWRDGQRSDVQIYRLFTAGCIEEKIFQRQIAKLSLADQVCSRQSASAADAMKFSAEELMDLFSVQEDYHTCQTHESLHCNCVGDGRNLEAQPPTSSDNKQINDLMNWQHFGPGHFGEVLEEAHLSDAGDNISYIFKTQTELV